MVSPPRFSRPDAGQLQIATGIKHELAIGKKQHGASEHSVGVSLVKARVYPTARLVTRQ
jgi:hypothetical protein